MPCHCSSGFCPGFLVLGSGVFFFFMVVVVLHTDVKTTESLIWRKFDILKTIELIRKNESKIWLSALWLRVIYIALYRFKLLNRVSYHLYLHTKKFVSSLIVVAHRGLLPKRVTSREASRFPEMATISVCYPYLGLFYFGYKVWTAFFFLVDTDACVCWVVCLEYSICNHNTFFFVF